MTQPVHLENYATRTPNDATRTPAQIGQNVEISQKMARNSGKVRLAPKNSPKIQGNWGFCPFGSFTFSVFLR